MPFRLTEYARAGALHQHSPKRAVAEPRRHPQLDPFLNRTSRVGTTQVTLDSGEVVEFEGAAIQASMSLSHEDISTTNVEALLTTVDQAAGVHHEELTKWVLANLEKLTSATGNTIDAAANRCSKRYTRCSRR